MSRLGVCETKIYFFNAFPGTTPKLKPPTRMIVCVRYNSCSALLCPMYAARQRCYAVLPPWLDDLNAIKKNKHASTQNKTPPPKQPLITYIYIYRKNIQQTNRKKKRKHAYTHETPPSSTHSLLGEVFPPNVNAVRPHPTPVNINLALVVK